MFLYHGWSFQWQWLIKSSFTLLNFRWKSAAWLNKLHRKTQHFDRKKNRLPELFSHVVPCSIFRGIISSLYNVQEVLGTEWSTFGITRENVSLFDLMLQILANTAYGVSEQSGGKCLCVRTTPLSQITLILSWTPATPWGIFVKSSLPRALCLMLKGRCSDATTLRVSLETEPSCLVKLKISRQSQWSYQTYRLYTYFPSRPIRYPGVLGSMRRGGTTTWAAAWAQSWW